MNKEIDPKDLENLVAPCVETPTIPENPGGETGEEGSGDNNDGSNNNNNNNNNNNGSGNNTTPPPIDPIWGLGGFSLDKERGNN